MTESEIMHELSNIIDEVKTAVLATVDEKGKPCMRWVTPALISGRKRAIYIITYPGAKKVKHIQQHPDVQWLFQSKALDKIIYIEGKVNVIDNPSLRSEVLEIVGPRLNAFWKIYGDERDLLVLETLIEEGTFYLPMKGKKEKVSFT